MLSRPGLFYQAAHLILDWKIQSRAVFTFSPKGALSEVDRIRKYLKTWAVHSSCIIHPSIFSLLLLLHSMTQLSLVLELHSGQLVQSSRVTRLPRVFVLWRKPEYLERRHADTGKTRKTSGNWTRNLLAARGRQWPLHHGWWLNERKKKKILRRKQ